MRKKPSKLREYPCKQCGRKVVPLPDAFCSSSCGNIYSGNMEICEKFNIRCPFSLRWGSGDKCSAIGEECERWRKDNKVKPLKSKPKPKTKDKQPEGLDKWRF